MKTHVLTTTLSHDSAVWLDETARKYQRTKRDILEAAIKRFREENIKKSLKASFRRALNDSEIMNMTEEGARDFWEQIKKLDQK